MAGDSAVLRLTGERTDRRPHTRLVDAAATNPRVTGTDTRNPLQAHIQIDARLAERAEADACCGRIGDHPRGDDRAALRQIAAQPVGGPVPAGRCSRPQFVGRAAAWAVGRSGARRHRTAAPALAGLANLRRQSRSAGQAMQTAFAAVIAWVSCRSATPNSSG